VTAGKRENVMRCSKCGWDNPGDSKFCVQQPEERPRNEVSEMWKRCAARFVVLQRLRGTAATHVRAVWADAPTGIPVL
jgi:hypothetical protein